MNFPIIINNIQIEENSEEICDKPIFLRSEKLIEIREGPYHF